MLQIVQVETEAHRQQVRDVLREYIGWLHAEMQRAYSLDIDAGAMLEKAMQDGGEFAPPDGRMLLVLGANGEIAGVGCLRRGGADFGEIKRMYVRPAFRGRGIGGLLVTRLCEEARAAGYTRLRLDSAPFMATAHALYRSLGFQEIPSYLGNEVTNRFGSEWLYMELIL